MARVAARGTVHVAIYVGVVEIGGITTSMASCRATEDRVVRGVGMAGCANAIGIPVVDREQRVVRRGQCCREPSRGGVARVAGCRPACRRVGRIGGAVVIGHVAPGAECWRSSEHVVDVA